VESPLSSVDPITFEILSHRLHQIAKEMGTTLERVEGNGGIVPGGAPRRSKKERRLRT